MTIDPEELREQALAAQEQQRLEREEKEAAKREAYDQEVEAANAAAKQRIPSIENAVKVAASNGKMRHIVAFGKQRVYGDNVREFEDLVEKPAELIAEHFRNLGFGAKVEIEHTTEYINAEPGPGPTIAKIAIWW